MEVFLANMGPIPQHKARADFSTSFLQVGEFNVHLNNGFQDDEGKPNSRWEKAAAALKAGIDEAGTPYDCAVIDDFISVSANCFDILKDLQKRKGMIE